MAILYDHLGLRHKYEPVMFELQPLGYTFRWQYYSLTDSLKFAILKLPTWDEAGSVLGVYDNEGEALAMVKLLVSQAKYES